ncbi:MAG: glycosyltransferase family 2 protein [Candidatus Binatia bacterium]
MKEPQVTIVVVPRERFSFAARSLQSIYEQSDIPFRLVYVDGGSPSSVRRYIERQAEERGFELIRTEHYLSPNQARNLGLQRVKSKYVVFIDNDVIVAPGWLAPLVQCAEETGAAVVSPLNCEGEPAHEVIHFAGGECHVRVEETAELKSRHMVDKISRQGQRLPDVRDQLKRERTEVAEFHCLMARTGIFDKIGPFDEGMLSVRENLDFCLMVTQAGGTVYFEPTSIITYLGGCALDWSDIPFYVVRWSDEWTLASLHHFRDKWDLSEDAYFAWQYKTLGAWRRKVYLVQNTLLRRVPSHRIRLLLEKLVFPVEELLAKGAFARYARRQARAIPRRQTRVPVHG